MAEGFEPYHVPQQSRRDKLRVNTHHPPPKPGCAGESFQASAALLSLYDPSLITSDFISCAASAHQHAYGFAPGAASDVDVKEEGANLMAFLSGGGGGGGGGGTSNVFSDPNLPSQLNPSSIQDINGGPYAYPSQAHCLQSYHTHKDSNGTGQSLSLSLSSNHNNNPNLPLELNLQQYYYGPSKTRFGPIEFSKSAVPLGPFTGYASVLKGSRFLRPAQQLLEELCDMGRAMYSDTNGSDPGLLDRHPLDTLNRAGITDDCGDRCERTRKTSSLLSMLDEVYKRYRQYYQQMQVAVGAFESVAGLSSAAPFANLALNSVSKHFQCLKIAITDQLQCASKAHGKTNADRYETSGKGPYGRRSFLGPGFVDPPVWRPQRGLPEHAVTVLRSWLFEHFLHPYPTDTDKLMLAKQTGLSRNQVSNWFINARVRLWKPMVEEIHILETSQQGPQSPNITSDHQPTTRSIEPQNTYPGEFNPDPFKLPNHNLLANNNNNNSQLHGSHGMSSAGGNGGVSLTLGLYQNGLGLPDVYPINAARRFGLDSRPGEEYVVSGFTGRGPQFGRGDHGWAADYA